MRGPQGGGVNVASSDVVDRHHDFSINAGAGVTSWGLSGSKDGIGFSFDVGPSWGGARRHLVALMLTVILQRKYIVMTSNDFYSYAFFIFFCVFHVCVFCILCVFYIQRARRG
ncbi:polymorphic toxin type 25 domain-containing protein [Enterobacteriaceae bacterium C34A]